MCAVNMNIKYQLLLLLILTIEAEAACFLTSSVIDAKLFNVLAGRD